MRGDGGCGFCFVLYHERTLSWKIFGDLIRLEFITRFNIYQQLKLGREVLANRKARELATRSDLVEYRAGAHVRSTRIPWSYSTHLFWEEWGVPNGAAALLCYFRSSSTVVTTWWKHLGTVLVLATELKVIHSLLDSVMVPIIVDYTGVRKTHSPQSE